MTPLDHAHAAMQDGPDADAARLRFYAVLADSEVYLMLAGEAADDSVTPALFDLSGGRFALIFDTEERLAEFAGRAVPYAGLPARALTQMLAGQGVGLALNLQVAPSSFLLDADGVDWLAATLIHAPEEVAQSLSSVAAPDALPDTVRDALARKLSQANGLAVRAYLAAARYADGAPGHVLAFVDARAGAEAQLAQAAGEALTFSGIDAGVIDVMFLTAGDALAERLDRVALRFDIPQPVAAARPEPAAPGSDPAKPPKLR